MVFSMILSHDLFGIWVIVRNQIPNPEGAIADKDQLWNQVSPTFAARSPDQLAKLVSRANTAKIMVVCGAKNSAIAFSFGFLAPGLLPF
jgi:hypothetical protein